MDATGILTAAGVIGGVGILVGLLLGKASRVFKVEENETDLDAAYRELCEETAITKKDIILNHFMNFEYIKEGDLITSAAIDALLSDIKEGNEYIFPTVTEKEIEQVLQEYGIHIVDAEVVPMNFPPDPNLALDRWLFTRPAWKG